MQEGQQICCPVHRDKLENGEVEIEGLLKGHAYEEEANSDCLGLHIFTYLQDFLIT